MNGEFEQRLRSIMDEVQQWPTPSGNGCRVDFENTLIILTTNVGANLIMGLSSDPKFRQDPDALARQLHPELFKVFTAALLGLSFRLHAQLRPGRQLIMYNVRRPGLV
jgi:ATP-dependent Clp protease ATP-binding subunit ClpA